MQPTQPSAGKAFYEDTYFIEGTENNPGSGSLAILVEINFDTHRIAWQDTTQHAKSRQFDKVTLESDGSLDIETEGKHLKLRLLTIDLFKKHIHNSVPKKFLTSDEVLRSYYVATVRDPYNEGLYTD